MRLSASFEHAIALAYPLPKVFYHRGQLYRRADYQRLTESRDVMELARGLAASPFYRTLVTGRSEVTALDLERRLQRHVLSFCFEMAEIAPPETRAFLHAYLSRSVFTTLSTLLKSRLIPRMRAPPIGDTDRYVWRETGFERVLDEALTTRNVQELQHSVRGDRALSAMTGAAVSLYWKHGSASMVDAASAKAYYDCVLESMDRLSDADRSNAHRLVGLEVDRYNAMTTLRSKSWGMNESALRDALVPRGYRLTEPTRARLLGSTIPESLRVIVDAASPDPPPDSMTVPMVEVALKRTEARECWKLLLQTPFTPVQIFAIARLRLVEYTNLLAVIYGVEYTVEPTRVLTYLVTVHAGD